MDEPTFLIWSNKQGRWFRPHESGYTLMLEEAGRYTRGEAERIVERVTSAGLIWHQGFDERTGLAYPWFNVVIVPAPESHGLQQPPIRPVDATPL